MKSEPGYEDDEEEAIDKKNGCLTGVAVTLMAWIIFFLFGLFIIKLYC